MTLVDAGLWCGIGEGDFAGRPALFLDRDGVVVVDTNYLGRVEDLQMIAGSAEAIARCNILGIPGRAGDQSIRHWTRLLRLGRISGGSGRFSCGIGPRRRSPRRRSGVRLSQGRQ